VKWSTGGDPQTVESRSVGANGSLGSIRSLSEPDPSAFGTYVSGVDVAHSSTGDAMASWLEITLTGSSCVSYGYGYSFGGNEDCVVHYYVRARAVPSGGALGPVRTLAESEYSPGTVTDPTYLSSPRVVVDDSGAATVVWTSTTVSAGCSAYYGYGYQYDEPSECTADTLIDARGIGTAGVPDPGTTQVFESHSVGGYGRSELGDVVVAADGTVSVAWLNAPSADNYYCAGGNDLAVEIRQIGTGGLGPAHVLDTDGGGECGWTAPRADVSAGGAVTVAWGKPGGVANSRVAPSGVPGAVQQIDGHTVFFPPDVGVGPDATATVVWSDGGAVRARRIGPAGALGPTRILDSVPSGSDYYYAPQVGVAADGSAGVAWGWQRWAPGVRLGVRAVRIDAAGTPQPAQTLAGSSPDRYFFRELPQVGGGAGTLLATWLAPPPGTDSWHLPSSEVRASRFLPSPSPPPPGPSTGSGAAAATAVHGIATAQPLIPVKKGKAMLALSCAEAGPCAGVASLVVKQSPPPRSGRHKRPRGGWR
jgi:hypothetical protein